MKRRKLPQLRIAKKYRNGKLMTAVIAAFEAAPPKAKILKTRWWR